jgi:hypothetical protein
VKLPPIASIAALTPLSTSASLSDGSRVRAPEVAPGPATRPALTALLGSVAVAIVGLLIFRDDLRARLRQARPAGVPILTDAAVMIASYLTAEQDLGRIAADADVDTLAPTLIGAGHLLFADQKGTPPEAGVIARW